MWNGPKECLGVFGVHYGVCRDVRLQNSKKLSKSRFHNYFYRHDELHQTPNESQKAKCTFCGWSHDLRPHHHGKKRKDAFTDSGLGASTQTLVLRRKIRKNFWQRRHLHCDVIFVIKNLELLPSDDFICGWPLAKVIFWFMIRSNQ